MDIITLMAREPIGIPVCTLSVCAAQNASA